MTNVLSIDQRVPLVLIYMEKTVTVPLESTEMQDTEKEVPVQHSFADILPRWWLISRLWFNSKIHGSR